MAIYMVVLNSDVQHVVSTGTCSNHSPEQIVSTCGRCKRSTPISPLYDPLASTLEHASKSDHCLCVVQHMCVHNLWIPQMWAGGSWFHVLSILINLGLSRPRSGQVSMVTFRECELRMRVRNTEPSHRYISTCPAILHWMESRRDTADKIQQTQHNHRYEKVGAMWCCSPDGNIQWWLVSVLHNQGKLA